MRTRTYPRQTAAAQGSTSISWLYVFVTIICVAFLAVGFFFAARQHFTAMDLGIKNSKLRKQVEDMDGEKRRLLLSREIVRSPSEIKRIAAKNGLREGDDLFATVSASSVQTDDQAHVVKTAMSAPVPTALFDKKDVKAFFAKDTGKDQPAKTAKTNEKGSSKRISSDLVVTTRSR